MADQPAEQPSSWPSLPLESWKDTYATLHMWTQMVGKVRLALTPLVNHWWNVPLYVSARGLTTSPMPYQDRMIEIWFDFIQHRLVLQSSNGLTRTLPLRPISVADFYGEFQELLRSANVHADMWKMPVEIPNPIAFDQDRVHASYQSEYAERFWHILLEVDRVLQEFRSRFIGKCSPVHFFWGSFDLAVTRFSGRRAPEKPGADAITREAYSHEVSSVGFWPGGGDVPGAAFYSYMAPEPTGFREARARPDSAFYQQKLGEFILMYDDVQRAASPRAALLDFCESTYAAGANLGHWDRANLERDMSASSTRK
ncbi:MAG TPA: DUF5996 family protein [Candidatus Acidoferrales bacterium]|nr:DUF5996 family protein [Candidatus Acidoferrales bacterium]